MYLGKYFFVNSKGRGLTRFFGLVFFFVLGSGLLYSQTSPTVTLTDTDADNLLSASDTVTITAAFSEAMIATPTISITGVVTNVAMTKINNADPTWTAANIATSADGAYSVFAADMDGDGDMDIYHFLLIIPLLV